MKSKNENAKNPKWEPPVDLPHAEPEDYEPKLESLHAGPPRYTLPGHSAGMPKNAENPPQKPRHPSVTSVVGDKRDKDIK